MFITIPYTCPICGDREFWKTDGQTDENGNQIYICMGCPWSGTLAEMQPKEKEG